MAVPDVFSVVIELDTEAGDVPTAFVAVTENV